MGSRAPSPRAPMLQHYLTLPSLLQHPINTWMKMLCFKGSGESGKLGMHNRYYFFRDALKKDSRGLCRGAAGNPRVPLLLPGTLGNFPGCLCPADPGSSKWGRLRTPVFLPGESQGQRSLLGCHLWGHTESDMADAT